MKKLLVILPACLALLCAFSGCSKAKEKKANLLTKPQGTKVTDAIAADAPIDFKVKWNFGQRYTFRLEAVVGADVTLPTTNEPQKYVVAFGHNYSVLPGKYQSDGGQELDLEMTAQRFFVQLAERNSWMFDSRQTAEHDAANPVSPVLRKLLNVPIKYFLDGDGKLTRSEGLDALAANPPGGNIEVNAKAQILLTEENFRMLFAFLSAAQPSEAMKIGQTWPLLLNSDGVVLNGEMKAAGWDEQDNRECVRIEFQGKFSAKSIATNGASAITIEDGTFSGTSWFDPQLGTMLNSSVVGHMTAKNSDGDQPQPSRINISSNLRLLSLEEK